MTLPKVFPFFPKSDGKAPVIEFMDSIAQGTPPPNFGPPIILHPDAWVEESGDDKNLLRKLLELDLGLQVATIMGLFILLVATLVLVQKVNTQSTKIATVVNKVPSAQQSAVLAAPNEQPAMFINNQVLSIDQAFNTNPTTIKLTVSGQLKKEVFGYLPYWAVDKADEINLTMMTSVSYFGLEVGPDGEIIKSSNSDAQIGGAWDTWEHDPKLVDFIRKLKQNRIKALVTFKSFSNTNIEQLVRSPQAAQTFISNVLYEVSSKDLDGVNIDFEYVGTPPDDVRDKFTLLMSDLNKELKRQYPKSILTIATYPRSASVNEFFDVQLLAQNANALVIMGYDFSTPKSAFAGPVAPMGGAGENLTSDINAYLDKVPANKIILAVPYYGYDWPTKDRTENSAVVGDSSNVGVLMYADIIDATKRTTIDWDDTSQTPWYSYIDPKTSQPHVVHFENTRSLSIKFDLINAKNLQGVGIWALGFEGRDTELDQLIADKFANN